MAAPVKQLVWTREATNSLQEIVEYLRESGSPNEQVLAGQIISQAEMLRQFPQLGLVETQLSSTTQQVRSLLAAKRYRIIYRYGVEQEMIRILLIVDTRRNPDQMRFIR